ncbi:exonuclease subunit SbcD [Fibrobacter sp.]|uniref:exonuclease subunit SbcD n=1 Tax=Fibrobacter sp. TaxID=35828 RepID=UPI0038901DE0
MKLIHTADWHLGNSMHDIDRLAESRQFLDWLKERIVEFGAECLVVSGDIFDTANPPLPARRMYFRFLASLLDTCCKNIVLVGGNHDSGALLDAPRDLLDALNIQMVGSLGERSVEELVKELTDADGNVVGISAAVPYVREMELRRFKPEESTEDFAQCTYRGLYSAVYDAAEVLRAGRDIPIVATGHLYASKLEGRPENDEGKDAKEHGMRDIVGNLGTIPVSVFPDGFDYVALGHIHYTTKVAENSKVRYSGSPFVLGFDETSIPHHILAIDLKKGEEPAVQKIETPQYFKFLRVSGTIEDIVMQLNQLKSAPAEKPLKVEVVFDYVPGVNINEILAPVLEGAPFDVVSKKANRADALTADSFSDETLESIEVLRDEEIFKLLLMSKTGVTEMNDDVQKNYDEYLSLFMQVVEEVNNENNGEA